MEREQGRLSISTFPQSKAIPASFPSHMPLLPTPGLGLEALAPERPTLPVDATGGAYVAVYTWPLEATFQWLRSLLLRVGQDLNREYKKNPGAH